MRKGIVVAIGGNAIAKQGSRGTIQEQFYAARECMERIADLIDTGVKKLLITHGNGPQVGNAILRSEIASKTIPLSPMDLSVAETQGGMGYMLQQVLANELRKRKIDRAVVTSVTQVEVDVDDPAFESPSKPVGMFYSEEEARALQAARGWIMKEDAGRGWRRVVPSPKPKRIIEAAAIAQLFDKGTIVIACGGGGVPVVLNRHGLYYGTEAVIDKDLTSALIATQLRAERLMILTGVKHAYINYHTPNEYPIAETTVEEMEDHLAAGQFAAGSMQPKVEACLQFLAEGGKEAIITSIPKCLEALKGLAGTRIRKE